MSRRVWWVIPPATAMAAVAVRRLQTPATRLRLRRSATIWRLTARNGARWGIGKVRGVRRDEAAKAALNDRFAVRAAEDVAREFGQMKGVMMKAGQLVGFILEALPDEAQAALATLQADAPPMAPGLAAHVIRDEFGIDPHRLFLDWADEPFAAASIGQVHRAVTRDGRTVAVKVQYPGIGDTMQADLDNVQFLYAMFGAFALKGLDTRALVDELRSRMIEELDYRREAANLNEFADFYAGHPFIRTPTLVPEYSAGRVITTEWVDGMSWAEFERTASPEARQRAGEVLWRFAQGSVHRLGAFNGDPHPGNYRFHADGTVTFLDFGLVKRWSGDEWTRLSPSLDAILAQDPTRLVRVMVELGFLRSDHGLDPTEIAAYVSMPYQPYLVESFTFTREFVRETLGSMMQVKGPFEPVVEQLNMPTSFVILDRVVWGVSALLGKLGATGPWRDMLMEYRAGAAPATPLGITEAAWFTERHSAARTD